MVSKNAQKIRKANDMSNLPIVPTQVTLRGNVDSLDAASASQLYSHLALGGQGIKMRGL